MTVHKTYIICQGRRHVPDREVNVDDSKLPIDLRVKPNVKDETLKNIVEALYKGQGSKEQIGNGTTMDAVRNERATGVATKNSFHSKKARILHKGLENVLRSSKLNKHDKAVARALREDIKKALSDN